MKIVIAIDSFKGSLTSLEAGNAAKAGILRVFHDAEVLVRPLADGGEGTVDALVSGMGGTLQTVLASDPLGRKIPCKYGIIDQTAVIEMSAAAGITLLTDTERNPLYTTTYGVGEIILDAIEKGCREFIIGIGGSATNDGGIGMLQALGFDFLDAEGKQISFGAQGIAHLSKIDGAHIRKELAECLFFIACDVSNPLCGEEGCSAVYSPQKGATPAMIKEMDESLANYAALAAVTYPRADKDYPGAGAAGGMGFAFLSFLGARLVPGVELIVSKTNLEKAMTGADVVITGEGRLDGQTAMGKAPIGVASLAKKHGIPVLAFAGGVTKDAVLCNEKGIDAFFPIVRGVTTLDEAIKKENAHANLRDAVEQAFRLLKAAKTIK